MYDREEAFVNMLLTMSLSANREEYAHPLSSQELRRLTERAKRFGIGGLSKLMGVDISGLMLKLDLSEEEAYRLYVLLNRSVQLSYAIENLAEKYGIEILVSSYERSLTRVTARMGDSAPSLLYARGESELLNSPMLAILGISGVKTTPAVRESVDSLVKRAVADGYVILTGGEPGVCRLTANLTMEHGGKLVCVTGGEMTRRIAEPPIVPMLGEGRVLILSAEHPEAMCTVPHAITRNKVALALAEAAFIINTDGKRGESDAIRNHYCDYIYAWTGCDENQTLINRGAIPIGDIKNMNFEAMARLWHGNKAEQLSMFELI